MTNNFLHPNLQAYIATLESEFVKIPEARQVQLLKLSAYIRKKRDAAQPIQITVICTHNSRRSHMGQIWLQVAAACYGITNFQSFSGGTEATAFHPNAIAAMRRAGLEMNTVDDNTNPIYNVRFSKEHPRFVVFSKVYNATSNPQRNFAAVLVCDSADEACPTVMGAEARFAITYQDPKAFDATDVEAEKYDERTRQIAREFFFAMSRVSCEF